MPEVRTTRRLAAILAADVVGYSRMMGADEAGTLAALKRHREAVFDPAVAAHNGRIVKLIGDGTLVEFASVVDAVNCALAIQRAIAAEAPAGPKITLRIGVNLGDVIIDGDDIYGDGVNVAARLEPLAEPGGVCVASIVNESVGSRIDVALQGRRRGRRSRTSTGRSGSGNGIPDSEPAPASRAEARTGAGEAGASRRSRSCPSTTCRATPSRNISPTASPRTSSPTCPRSAGCMVIARNSSFAYKGKTVDIRTVGRELGVRSVLEGTIRRAGNRVRITAQLIDAATGGHLWAERYDRDLTDIFAVQDEVTPQIVGALKVTLTPPRRRALPKPGPATSRRTTLSCAAANSSWPQPRTGRRSSGRSHSSTRRSSSIPTTPTPTPASRWPTISTFTIAGPTMPDQLARHRRRLRRPGGREGVRTSRSCDYVAAIVAVVQGRLRPGATAEADTALALNPNYALAHQRPRRSSTSTSAIR